MQIRTAILFLAAFGTASAAEPPAPRPFNTAVESFKCSRVAISSGIGGAIAGEAAGSVGGALLGHFLGGRNGAAIGGLLGGAAGGMAGEAAGTETLSLCTVAFRAPDGSVVIAEVKTKQQLRDGLRFRATQYANGYILDL
jgi:hypothetical protein